MLTIFRLFFPPPLAANVQTRWRIVVLYVGITFFVLSRLPLALPDVLDQTADYLGWNPTRVMVVNAVFLLIILLAFAGARRARIQVASSALIVVLLLESAFFLLLGSWDSLQGWMVLWLALMLGVFLLPGRASSVAVGVALFLITLASLGDSGDLDGARQSWRLAHYLTLVLGTVTLGVLSYHAACGIHHRKQTTTQDDTQILIDLGAEVANSLFERHELDRFLKQFIGGVVNHFSAIHHAEVYLIQPDSQVARLRASTGPVGQQLLAQEHELDIGGLSAVGRATLTRSELLIRDYTQGTSLKPNPLLHETRAEFVLPLVVNAQIIGALDVQSPQPNAFSPVDLTLLRAIGVQLAIALDGLQLYEEAQRNIRENQALYQQTQTSLREIERLNYQLTGRAWSDYLRMQPESTALTLDLESGRASGEAEWTPTLNEAATHHQVITIAEAGRRILALPIIVRNEAVGAMEFELDSEDALPDDMIELAQAVSQRLGLALENRRLLDETQRIAQREALINDIGAELQAATGVDVIIQQAARQLQEALAPQQITIRLGKPAADAVDRPVPERGRA